MTNGNEPVSPVFDANGDCSVGLGGLTKREYFAAMAMQGMLMQGFSSMNQSVKDSAGWAVDAADDLIAALNTTKQQDNG